MNTKKTAMIPKRKTVRKKPSKQKKTRIMMPRKIPDLKRRILKRTIEKNCFAPG